MSDTIDIILERCLMDTESSLKSVSVTGKFETLRSGDCRSRLTGHSEINGDNHGKEMIKYTRADSTINFSLLFKISES